MLQRILRWFRYVAELESSVARLEASVKKLKSDVARLQRNNKTIGAKLGVAIAKLKASEQRCKDAYIAYNDARKAWQVERDALNRRIVEIVGLYEARQKQTAEVIAERNSRIAELEVKLEVSNA